MGVIRDIKQMSREYLKDPHGQYYRNLDKLLQIGINQGLSPADIQQHVNDYFK